MNFYGAASSSPASASAAAAAASSSSSGSMLSAICVDLSDKIRSAIWPVDKLDMAIQIVDRFFNDPQLDLLCVLPQSSQSFVSESETQIFVSEFEQIIQLIGTTSIAFKALIHSDNEQNFEYFISSFGGHLERSVCNLPPEFVDQSVFMYLLADYVCFMMPVERSPTPTPTPTTTPTSSPIGGGSGIAGSPSSSDNLSLSTSTPLTLFKEDALQRYSLAPSRVSMRTLRSYSQSLSPHFLPFIYTLVKSLCSLSSWPSDYRLNALRYVIKQYHIFVLTLTDDGMLSQVKSQLLHNAPFVDQLYDFLYSMFVKWPDNSKFAALFEVWMTWIRPWRYLEGRSKHDIEHFESFVECNQRFYTNLMNAFFNRLFVLDNPESVLNLRNYLAVIASEPLRKVYEWLKYDLQEPIIKIGAIAAKWCEYELKLVDDEYERLEKQNWFDRFISFSYEDDPHLQKLTATLVELNDLTNAIASAASTDFQTLLHEGVLVPAHLMNKSAHNSPSASSSQSPSSGSPSSQWSKPIPDHFVDPTTKFMYLTDLGRKQIRRGTHRFDLSHCSESIPPLLASRRSDEIWWLAKLLYAFSCLLNKTRPIRYLSRSYNDCSIIGMLARVLLDPEYPRIVVPSFTRNSASCVMKPSLNLRRFAQYKYVLVTLIFALFLWLIPLCYLFPLYIATIALVAVDFRRTI